LAAATSIGYSNSCDYLNGKQARINCYDEYQRTIPLAKTKLPEGQQVVSSYRCGNRLLQADMTIGEANQACGLSNRPSDIKRYIQSFEVHHRGYYGYRYVSLETYEMEKWTFKKYGRFRHYIVFRDDVIYQIIQDRAVRN
jgi:hypothetical protein